jgi:hypothetical protein
MTPDSCWPPVEIHQASAEATWETTTEDQLPASLLRIGARPIEDRPPPF